MKVGLNLYSIRNYLDTEENFLFAANELKKMGYSYIQYSGGAFDADMIKRVSEASGLPVVLTHVPMDRIINDTEALMEEHTIFIKTTSKFYSYRFCCCFYTFCYNFSCQIHIFHKC